MLLLRSLFATFECLLRPMRRLLRRSLRRTSPAVRRCTACAGLVDSLPAELLPLILASGNLEASDLARVATSCSAFAHVVLNDAESDAMLWEPVCRARWARKAYSPLDVYPERLHGLTWRACYVWAERDGARKVGTGEDMSKVFEWTVKFPGNPAHVIGPFPYRLDHTYVSPSFEGSGTMRYSVKPRAGGAIVAVDRIPEVRMVRRADWGWELRNMIWVARSVSHAPQPTDQEEMRRLVVQWRRERGWVVGQHVLAADVGLAAADRA